MKEDSTLSSLFIVIFIADTCFVIQLEEFVGGKNGDLSLQARAERIIPSTNVPIIIDLFH